MIIFWRTLLSAIAISLAWGAVAAESVPALYRRDCTPTAALAPAKAYPGVEAMIPGNDLAQPTGKSIPAAGQMLYVYGHVLDHNCVPVSDALVEIWQADPNGKYVQSSMGQRLDPFPEFVNTGRAVTDNLGGFTFLTLFPGTESATSAPHLNFRITRETFPDLETQLFFAGEKRNEQDSALTGLSPAKREGLLANVSYARGDKNILIVRWDAILDGENPYRRY